MKKMHMVFGTAVTALATVPVGGCWTFSQPEYPLSIAACDATSSSFMTDGCLSALTDRAVADAAAFLNAQ